MKSNEQGFYSVEAARGDYVGLHDDLFSCGGGVLNLVIWNWSQSFEDSEGDGNALNTEQIVAVCTNFEFELWFLWFGVFLLLLFLWWFGLFELDFNTIVKAKVFKLLDG